MDANGRKTEEVRVGIVGLGNIGRYHAEQLSTLADRAPVALVGGMDIDESARERFADEFGVETYDTRDALYGTVDAVVVTTPNRFHEEYTVAALEAGLDVLVEKPLAHTMESAERVADAARDADASCMVGFHNRFAAPVEVLRGRIDEGRFGDVYHVEANYVRRRGVPGRGSWFTDRATAGGGALIDIGAHALDLALHLMDFPEVVEVTGVTRDGFGSREDYTYLHQWGEDGDGGFDVDDSATALVRCADGATISLEVAWAANRPQDNGFVVQGTEAGATFDRESGALTLYETSDVGGPHFTDARVETDGDPPHLAEQQRFVEAVRNDEEPPVTVEQALSVQRVIEAIYRSSETERAVRLDGDGDEDEAAITANTTDD